MIWRLVLGLVGIADGGLNYLLTGALCLGVGAWQIALQQRVLDRVSREAAQ